MKSLTFISVVFFLGTAIWWLYPSARTATTSSQTREVDDNARDVVAPHAGDGSEREPADQNRESAAVASLKLQLAEKDRTIQTLLLRSAEAPKPPPPTAEEAETHAILAVANALDKRLTQAPRDDAAAGRLQREMATAIRQLPADVDRELDCGSTLCRLVLRAEDATLRRAMLDVSEKLPKSFAGATVLRTAPGESTLYVATQTETLNVEGSSQ